MNPQLQLLNSNLTTLPSKQCFGQLISSSCSSFNGTACVLIPSKPSSFQKKIRVRSSVGFSSNKIKAVATTGTRNLVTVTATVTAQPPGGGVRDGLIDLFGKTLYLELISAEQDPKSGLDKPTVAAYAHKTQESGEKVTYEACFKISDEFGEVGGILVENEHHKEMFLKDIVLDGFDTGKVNISCNSWVHSKFDDSTKRVFFTNKSYLPSNTPEGLKKYREKELEILRGDGMVTERKKFERIYDYDVYNDIGDPDKSEDLKRPVLGGKERPYPRRCRTGRPRSKKDPSSESRSNFVYVPRDEAFSEVKEQTFSSNKLSLVWHTLVPLISSIIVGEDYSFPFFSHIDSLYNEGIDLPISGNGLSSILPRLISAIKESEEERLYFKPPATMERDRFFWFRDEEFSRQTLAGINPLSLKLVTEWPMKSKLDPNIYGPAESAITTQIIEEEIGGYISVEEAYKRKELFVLDYHDLFLPFVEKVRQQKGTTLYGSRTLFILTPDSTLRPLAIELTRPPMDGKPQWKQVFRPAWNSTDAWLWRLAKAHVLAHDSGIHQLVSHWLRTHCAVEPYVIASNRQLSAMHPIYRLLHPHFRYTMEMNAMARNSLINTSGFIESSFSPLKYSMELSSVVYDQEWQFNLQALPADLINRGLAVEDPEAEHGLRLTIKDYPYANDGLELWSSIKQWVTDYVKHYYSDPSVVESDTELQAWWTEIRTVGHGDKKDEPWWPVLKTPEDLIEIITTMVWVTSGHHAAVNFGQYPYAGYFPNRPTIARTTMPTEDPSDTKWEQFVTKPEKVLLDCFPSKFQAVSVMAVIHLLSTHSPDEEYLGKIGEPAWEEDPVVKAAFERFNGRMKQLEGIIDDRNANPNLKNRNGAGTLPYTLLKPFSEPGVTGEGVPYSISI